MTVEATLLVPSFFSVLNGCGGDLPAAGLDQRAWLRDVPAGDAIPAGVIASTHLGSDTAGTLRIDLVGPQAIDPGAVPIVPAVLRPSEITQAGKYEGDFMLVPGFDESPAITVTALVQDLFVWPLLALVAGAWAAWTLLRRSDQERPRELLRAQLRASGETYKRFRAAVPPCRYEVAAVFPASDTWNAGATSDFLAERLLFAIDRASTQIDLDLATEGVADLAELVGLLPKLCSQRGELRALAAELPAAESDVLDHHPELRPDLLPPSPMQQATTALLAETPVLRTADEAAAFLTRLRQQADAVQAWLQAWRYFDTVFSSWKEAMKLDPADRKELDGLDTPDSIARVTLWPAGDFRKVRGVVDKLEAIHLAAESAVRRSKAQPTPAAAQLGVPVALAGRRTESRTGAQIIAAVEARDRIEFVITSLVTTFAFLLLLYVGKNFGGSPWDYVTALVAGASGQVVINWKLLPWYRSYTPARAKDG